MVGNDYELTFTCVQWGFINFPCTEMNRPLFEISTLVDPQLYFTDLFISYLFNAAYTLIKLFFIFSIPYLYFNKLPSHIPIKSSKNLWSSTLGHAHHWLQRRALNHSSGTLITCPRYGVSLEIPVMESLSYGKVFIKWKPLQNFLCKENNHYDYEILNCQLKLGH